MSAFELSEQEIQRRESLNKLREMGINPYPADLYPVTDYATVIKDKFEEGKQVCLAGRMMSQRDMGKASFAELVMDRNRWDNCRGAGAGCGGGVQSGFVGIVHWFAESLHFTKW